MLVQPVFGVAAVAVEYYHWHQKSWQILAEQCGKEPECGPVVYVAFGPDQLDPENCYEMQLVLDPTIAHEEMTPPDIWANVFYLQQQGDRGSNPPEIRSESKMLMIII